MTWSSAQGRGTTLGQTAETMGKHKKRNSPGKRITTVLTLDYEAYLGNYTCSFIHSENIWGGLVSQTSH